MTTGDDGESSGAAVLRELRERLDEISGRLLAFALRRVAQRDAAEELVQETFLAAVAGAEAFGGRSELLTWLTSILRRKIVDHYRRAAREDRRASAVDPDEVAAGPFTAHGTWVETVARWPTDTLGELEKQEFWAAFDACRGKLPANLASVFVVRELDGLDPAAACELLGVSRNHLAVRLYRARMLLRECLERTWFRE